MKRRLSKDLLNDNKEKIINLPISKFVNTKFKEYAIYVLEQRGIPNFYDALTPVQRYILKNSPQSFVKTLTVVGRSIEDGYHHGNISLDNAINKLAKPFGNSTSLLEGDGFFGTEVSPDAAASRYTSVRINPKIYSILNKYKYLENKIPNEPYEPFWLDIPLGLLTMIVGISVGYKSTILPRKLEHIQAFLEGKRKSVMPYFVGYDGKIQKHKNLKNSWLFSSILTVEKNKINISNVPPLIKYSSLVKKIDVLLSKYESYVKIIDNSDVKINIDIIYTGHNSVIFNEILEYVNKITSIIVSENIIFIKDNSVITYECIEDYLSDYIWQLNRIKYHDTKYKFDSLNNEIQFLKYKIEFIIFMLDKKRTNIEIDNFLKPIQIFKNKLESLTSRKFTQDEIKESKAQLKQNEILLKTLKIEFEKIEKDFNNSIDPTIGKSVSSNKNSTIDLFDVSDISEDINGITVWNVNEEIEETEDLN